MSKAITTQATNLARSPFDVSANPLDTLRLNAIVESLARGKRDGMNFHAPTLFTKVCDEIRSLNGLSANTRLPDNVATEIRTIVWGLPVARFNKMQDAGFNPVRETATRVKHDFKTGTSSRIKAMQFEQVTSFELQLKDVTWDIKQCQFGIDKLEMQPFETVDEKVKADKKIEGKLEKLGKLQAHAERIKGHIKKAREEAESEETELKKDLVDIKE